jgi:hypothetical protein
LSARRLALLLCLGGLLGACRKREEPVHRTEPWLAHPSASSAGRDDSSRAPRRYHFTADSRVRFSVPGKKGKVSGSVPVQAGSLELDARELTSARASVSVDLTALTIDDAELPSGLDLGDEAPSAVALRWLELAPDVSADRREQFRLARFELSSVENWSGAPLDFSGRRRVTVRATAVGTLLLHGFRAPVRAEVALTPLPADAGREPKLSIRSTSALVLPLAPHAISARGPGGVVDALATARAGDGIGKNVRLELELAAEPDD